MAFTIKFNSETKKYSIKTPRMDCPFEFVGPYSAARMSILFEYPTVSHHTLDLAAEKLAKELECGAEECKGGYERECTNDFVYGFLLALED